MAQESHPFVRASRADSMVPERAIQAMFMSLLVGEREICVLDGGAHKGFHTFKFLEIENCRRIYAVEANQGLADALKKKCATLDRGERIQVVSAAVQEDPALDSVTFMQSDNFPGRSGIHSIFEGNREVQFETVTVPATTIDKIVEGRDALLAFIKLDLEGGEFNAIRGGLASIKTDRPIIVMENSVHSPRINAFTADDYFAMFQGIDYVPITFLGDVMTAANMFDFWYAWMAPRELTEEIAGKLRALVSEAPTIRT